MKVEFSMMCALLLFVTSAVLAFSCLLFQRRFLVSVRHVADVIAMVRQVDERELEDLLNERTEETLRANSSALRFKEAERGRARLLFEYLRRMAFNALVILAWAYAEQEKLEAPGMPKDETKAHAIRGVTEAGATLRLYAVFALSKLSSWLLLDGLKIWRIRNIASLRYANEIDGLKEYRRLADAAVALAAGHGNGANRRLATLLRGSDSPHGA